MTRLVCFAAVLSIIACPKEPAPPPPAPPPPAPAAPPTSAEPLRTGAEKPEPAGIAAGAKRLPEPTGTWTVDSAGTSVSFTIVSNSAGPITARFPAGVSGAFDPATKTGVFVVDLTKLHSVNKDGAANPLRDTNVIEAFFGARPLQNEALKPAVDDAWKPLAGKIAHGVTKAAFILDAVAGPAAELQAGTAEGVARGRLVLWESVEVPLQFAITATRTGDTVELRSKDAATFNIEDAVGTPLRQALFATMLAAGCAHQPGLQNDVSVMLESVKLTLRGQ